MTLKSETLESAPPAPSTSWVHEVLEPGQLSNAVQPFGRQAFNRRTIVLLWGLRVYVVLMVVLTGAQIWKALHPAG